MQILDSIETFAHPQEPLILTIGNFDGMHRGHQAVLKYSKELAGDKGQLVVLTFRNHPSEVLRPEQPTYLLCTLAHKLCLLEEQGIHTVIMTPFTRHLAQHSAASFIERVRQFLPFSHLVLGYDATLGRDRQGNPPTMQALGEEWGFQVHYLEEYRFEGKPVSSSRIREFLQAGNLEMVERLLNRPYSIYAPVTQGQGKGKQLGYPTANLDVTGLCLPPYGVYAIQVLKEQKIFDGIANLGIAPTIRSDAAPMLEVHLFQENQELYGQPIEVIFRHYIRPEKKFQHTEELREQIAQDILLVKELLRS